MPIRVYNSLTRRKEEFKPIEPGEVRMYVCGPTVYDLSHIGHARSAVAFDVIYRYLRYRGYRVRYTRNYTDVDDKIIKRAMDEGTDSSMVAERYIKAFDEDMACLGVETPTYTPRATESIKKMIEIISGLIDRGYAYTVDGDVFFCVRRFNDYGKLSGKNIDELASGARIEVDERKKDPLDFALWKKSKPGEPWWDSPWGRGRPGWHIECSAMCLEWLGETIDIHGGGKDLIFPHHENEIAQSEALTGRPFVRYWLHNGFVNIDKVKMSKSLGNILNIRDVVRVHTPEAVRFFLLSSHYRSPIDYTASSLREAEKALDRFYTTLKRMEEDFGINNTSVRRTDVEERMKPVVDAMDDDFNTAEAIGYVFEEVNRANRLMDMAGNRGMKGEWREELAIIREVFREAGGFLGVFSRRPEEYFDDVRSRITVPVEEIERLVDERNRARKEKNFELADRIRDGLRKQGIILEDTPKGTIWKVRIE